MLSDTQVRDLMKKIPPSEALDALQDHIEDLGIRLDLALDLIREFREDLAWFDTCNPKETV